MAKGSTGHYETRGGRRWCYVIELDRGADGRRRQKRKGGFATEDAAEKAMRKELVERDRGAYVDPATCTTGEYLAEWLAATAPIRAPATHHAYETIVRVRLLPAIGGVPLAKLTPLHVRRLYGELAAAYAPKTLRATHNVLRQALAQAVAWRIVAANPTDGAAMPADKRRREIATWTGPQAHRFLEATAGDDLHALWRLLLDGGLRIGEALALPWSHVDLDRGLVRVRRTLTKTAEGRWAIGEDAKTAAGRRTIAVAPETVAALRAHRTRQKGRRLRAHGLWRDRDLVFARGDGGHLNPGTVRAALGRATARHGLPRLTPHGLRHTCASLLMMGGMPLKVVSERLGHESIAITADLYGHVTEEADRAAAAAIGAILRGA